MVDDDLFFERGDAADAGTDPDAAPRRIGDEITCLRERLVRSSNRELRESIAASRFLGIGEIEQRVEIVHTSFTLRRR